MDELTDEQRALFTSIANKIFKLSRQVITYVNYEDSPTSESQVIVTYDKFKDDIRTIDGSIGIFNDKRDDENLHNVFCLSVIILIAMHCGEGTIMTAHEWNANLNDTVDHLYTLLFMDPREITRATIVAGFKY